MLVPDLESILLVLVSKILLQQYLPRADIPMQYEFLIWLPEMLRAFYDLLWPS